MTPRVEVEWETDGEEVGLPSHVNVPNNIDEDEIASWLSDYYGWLVASIRVLAEESPS